MTGTPDRRHKIEDKKVRNGEVKWSMEGHCEELERLLSTGLYVGIGEGMPGAMIDRDPIDWNERFKEICLVMEVAQKYNVPVSYHTGTLTGYAGARRVGRVLGGTALKVFRIEDRMPHKRMYKQYLRI